MLIRNVCILQTKNVGHVRRHNTCFANDLSPSATWISATALHPAIQFGERRNSSMSCPSWRDHRVVAGYPDRSVFRQLAGYLVFREAEAPHGKIVASR